MRKYTKYTHPLQKKQQRKQRTSGAYRDELQSRCDALLKELKSEREQQAPSPVPMSAR